MHFDMKNILKSNRNHTPKQITNRVLQNSVKKHVKTTS
jgi:hypothetical protein